MVLHYIELVAMAVYYTHTLLHSYALHELLARKYEIPATLNAHMLYMSAL